MITESFPEPSQTFVSNQIAYLEDHGIEVTVLALRRSRTHDGFGSSGGVEINVPTTFLNVPRNRGVRVIAALPIYFLALLLAPRTFLRMFNYKRYGRRVFACVLPFIWNELRQQTNCRRVTTYGAIHAQFGTLGPFALFIRDTNLASGPIVTAFRGADITVGGPGKVKMRLGSILEEGEAFIPVAHSFKEQLEALGCDTRRINVVYSGIDTEFFRRTPANETQHQSDTIQLVSVGRLVEKKGLEYALKGVAKFRALWPEKKLIYRIVGDGVGRRHLERLAENLGIGDITNFLGWQDPDAVREILATSEILLAPSVTASNGDKEGIPNVVKEAMALEVSVVATNHSGMNELVLDNITGILVGERDVDAIATSIERLARSPELRIELGQNARAFVREHFDWQVVYKELIGVYKSVALEYASGQLL